MGGHVGGEIASRTVADAVLQFVRATALDPEKTWPFAINPDLSQPGNRLAIAIRAANKQLADLIEADGGLGGAGATISAALFDGNRVAVSNVGDCRTYLIRNGGAVQITRDHSFVAEQIALGALNEEEARQHPMRHLVTRAVSGNPEMTVDTFEVPVQPGDRFLLCSDGIHSLLSEAELSTLAISDAPPEAICHQLIEFAKARGGTDNSTVIIVAVGPDGVTIADQPRGD
jgi:protein phosphatase